MPKFDINEFAYEEITTIRNLIEGKRKNLNLSKKTKRPVQRNDHLIGKNKILLIREYIPYQTDNENIILFFHSLQKSCSFIVWLKFRLLQRQTQMILRISFILAALILASCAPTPQVKQIPRVQA